MSGCSGALEKPTVQRETSGPAASLSAGLGLQQAK